MQHNSTSPKKNKIKQPLRKQTWNNKYRINIFLLPFGWSVLFELQVWVIFLLYSIHVILCSISCTQAIVSSIIIIGYH